MTALERTEGDGRARLSAISYFDLTALIVAIGAVVVLFNTPRTSNALEAVAYALSALSLAFGFTYFVWSGREKVTPFGLFALSIALFNGLSAVILLNDDRYVVDPHFLNIALLLSIWLQVIVAVLSARIGVNRHAHLTTPRLATALGSKRSLYTAVCAIGLSALTVAATLRESVGALGESSAFVLIVVLAIASLGATTPARFALYAVAILGFSAAYVELFHTGGGRLRLVALASSLLIIYSAYFSGRIVKIGVLASLPLAIGFLAINRLQFQESMAAGASTGRTGLESLIAPLHVFTKLLRAQTEDGYPLSLGFNLLSTFGSAVPASVWPGQPEALGYALVAIDNPRLYGTGFSTFATITGEGVYNFGLLGGLIFAAVVSVLVISSSNWLLTRSSEVGATSSQALLLAITAVVVAGSMGDLTWAGTHLFIARLVSRLFFALAVWILVLGLSHLLGRNLPAREGVPHRPLHTRPTSLRGLTMRTPDRSSAEYYQRKHP